VKKLITLLGILAASCSPLPAQNTLAGNLTVQQSVKFTGDITPPQLTADVNDYAPASFAAATIVRVSADAPRVITGLAGGADGRIVWLSNIGGYAITLANAFAGSSAANRFDLGGANYELAAGNGLGLWYDATASRWRPLNGLAAGGGGGGTGTVTSVAVSTANGVSATVANPTTTPTLTFSLGAITPSSVAATGNITGANLSGTNTGDQSDATLTFSDVTTNNVSTARHGFAPKLPNDAAKYLDGTGAWSTPAGGGGSGTVTSVSVVSANGVSGSVANASTTPAITLSIGAIAPTSVAATGTVTGSNLSGTNTGDQTSVTGNAGTATALATARTINGVSFDGTANITVPAAAGTLTGTTLASGVTASSLTSAAGGTVGTAAFTAATAYDPAGAAAAITLAGLGGVPTSRTVNGHALSSNVTVTAADTGAEPALGNPASNGYVLSSTTGGTRSWVAQTTAPVGANPSASVGLTSVNGSASTFLRSDGAPALDQSISPTWSGNHAFSNTVSARALAVTGTAGAGFITLPGQSSNPASPAAGTLLLHSSTVNGITRMEQDNEMATNLVYGRDSVFVARNTTGVTINKGSVVYTSGVVGTTPEISLARANSSTTLPALGVAVDNIAHNSFGQVMVLGVVTMNTTAFSDGNPVWVSPTTAGAMTATRPSGTTNYVQRVGTVLVSGVKGTLLVDVAPAVLNMETGTNAATWTGKALAGESLTLTTPLADAYVASAATWNAKQAGDTDLTALAGLSTTGIIARTGSGTAATRTITGTTNQVTVTNGDGVSGNPTLALPQSISTTSMPQFGRIGIGGAAYGGGTMLYVTTGSAGTAPAWVASDLIILEALESTNANFQIFSDATQGGGFCFSRPGLRSAGRVAYQHASDTLQFQTGGTVRVEIGSAGALKLLAYGAGTLVTDSSGNVTASSDLRLKNVQGNFTRGLADVIKIHPKLFTWKPESGMNTEDVNAGLIAQDVQDAIPEAVGAVKTSDGEEDDAKTGKKVKKAKREAAEYLTLSDRPIIAALINAVRELKEENDDLRARLTKLEAKK